MSADIIQFIRGPERHRERSDFRAIAFRSPVRPGDLAVDDADAAPGEDRHPESGGSGDA